jgi:hypothetical protein
MQDIICVETMQVCMAAFLVEPHIFFLFFFFFRICCAESNPFTVYLRLLSLVQSSTLVQFIYVRSRLCRTHVQVTDTRTCCRPLQDLEIIFSRFGTITSCDIIRDWKTGDSLCYAFLGFDNDQSCEEAYFKMNNVLVRGCSCQTASFVLCQAWDRLHQHVAVTTVVSL